MNNTAPSEIQTTQPNALNNLSRKNQPTTTRMLSLDVIRGLSIMGVLVVHQLIYGTWYSEGTALEVVPFWLVILLSPIVIMATWGGGFSMISSLAHTYNIYQRIDQGYSYKQAVTPVIFQSLFLFLLDPFRSLIFYRTADNTFPITAENRGVNRSILGKLLEGQGLGWPDPQKLYAISSLPSIALSGLTVAFVLWFLFRKGGKEKVKRNVIILLTLGFIFMGISWPIGKTLYPSAIDSLYSQGGWGYFAGYLLLYFVGGNLSFFPMGTYAFFGMAGGYLFILAKQNKVPLKKVILLFRGLGIVFMSAFLIKLTITVISVSDPVEALLDYQIFPFEWLFLSLGAFCFFYNLAVKKVEFLPEEKYEKFRQKTRFIRKFGVVTLSIYIFEGPINMLIAAAFHVAFGGVWQYNVIDSFMTNPLAIFLMFATSMLFWFTFVWLWSKTGFKFGLEYWLLMVSRKFRKVQSSRPIAVKQEKS